jgi:hypothetical protein
MWVDSKRRLTKSNETSNMENRIRRKLMKLYAVDKEKPTKKFVGRERKATEKEGKEHNTISLWRRGNALFTGEDDRRRFREKAILFAFFRSDSSNIDGTHLRAILLPPFFTIVALCATFLMGTRG